MKKLLALCIFSTVAAGCTPQSNETAPLVFGQTESLGVSVGAAATGANPELSVGYKSVNIAIVPTLVPDGSPGKDGYDHKLVGQGADTKNAVDAYSTFGHFSAEVENSEVGLGKFFATGVAAQYLAEGFGCAAATNAQAECFGKESKSRSSN